VGAVKVKYQMYVLHCARNAQRLFQRNPFKAYSPVKLLGVDSLYLGLLNFINPQCACARGLQSSSCLLICQHWISAIASF